MFGKILSTNVLSSLPKFIMSPCIMSRWQRPQEYTERIKSLLLITQCRVEARTDHSHTAYGGEHTMTPQVAEYLPPRNAITAANNNDMAFMVGGAGKMLRSSGEMTSV